MITTDLTKIIGTGQDFLIDMEDQKHFCNFVIL